ncbi:MAG: hypothetical protein WBF77_06680 [Sulfurimonadaceae bacterium]
MRSLLIASLLASALFGGIHETNEGLFLEIFENYDPQSKVIAEVSTEKGKIEQLRCRGTRDNTEWCRVRYHHDGVVLQGWSDKKSLDTIASRPNTKPTFEKRFGGRYGEEGRALLALNDGFLIVGTTESFGEGQKDAYALKVDKFGNKLWSETYGGGSDDIAEAVIPVKNGFMLAGSTWSIGSEGQNLYVLRISEKGELLWENGYYAKKRDRYLGKSLAKLNDDHVMVAGSEEHIKFFNADVFCYLSAINLNGQEKWVQRYGGGEPDRANSVIKVEDGFVFAGATETWGEDGKNMYVVKIDSSGSRVWHQAFGYDYDEEAEQVIATRDGGYLLVGTTNSDHNKLKDVYVVKIDANGYKQWQRHYGGKSDEEGLGVVETDDGYVIVGYTESTKDRSSDVYLLKIDRSGAIYWNKTYGGSGNDAGQAIVKVKDGFVITGYSEGPSGRGKDLYMLKVDLEGNLN